MNLGVGRPGWQPVCLWRSAQVAFHRGANDDGLEFQWKPPSVEKVADARAYTSITRRPGLKPDRRAVQRRPEPEPGPRGRDLPASPADQRNRGRGRGCGASAGRATSARHAPSAACAEGGRAGSRDGYYPNPIKTTAGPVTCSARSCGGRPRPSPRGCSAAGVTRTNALVSLVIAGFVRGLSVRDVEATLGDALGGGWSSCGSADQRE